jgi:rhomboid protease GluP
MPRLSEEFLLQLLQACAAHPPLYPARFAKDQNVDRDTLDVGLEELRRLGLVKLTDWVKGSGQGYALTEAGHKALEGKRLPSGRVSPAAAKVAPDPVPSEYERGEIARSAIFDQPAPLISRGLLAVNILFFVLGAIYASQNDWDVKEYIVGSSPATTQVLVRLGALDQNLVFIPSRMDLEYGPRPQFERIILSAFLHVGLIHLIMNMYFLVSLGQLIESMWGSARFLTIYAVAGVVSGCVVLLFQMCQRHTGLVAGASGCLFGLFVAMAVWFYFNRQYLPERLIQDWSRNLTTNAIILIFVNFLPNISWQAHLGGAIGGLFAALLLHVNRFHPSWVVRTLAIAALPMVPLGFFAVVLWQARESGLY